jgi:hypothetical protein
VRLFIVSNEERRITGITQIAAILYVKGEVSLTHARLEGARLYQANLIGAQLQEAALGRRAVVGAVFGHAFDSVERAASLTGRHSSFLPPR